MRPIAGVLDKFLKKEGLAAFEDGEKKANDVIFQNWEDIVGKDIADNTEPFKIAGNNLFIYVKNSVIMNEMLYYKKYIIRKIDNFNPGRVKNVTFRVKQ